MVMVSTLVGCLVICGFRFAVDLVFSGFVYVLVLVVICVSLVLCLGCL